MTVPRNPFHYLYVGETVSAEEFTDIFSTELVQYSMALFQPGHVVLSGANGMGKSMLFKLLDADVRLAYAQARKPFPIPGEAGRFIGAGINVNTARCNEFGNRRTAEGDHEQELMFGDFLNYFVVKDILRSVERLATNPDIAATLGIDVSGGRLEQLTSAVIGDPVWEGFLSEVSDFESLKDRVDDRIARYRRFMNGNDRALDPLLAATKTAAGEAVKVIVRKLRESGVVAADVPFFILIDQYEELATISGPDGRKADYRSVVNKILNSRDPTVSYRVGTRGYGWRDHLNIFGTDARLEQERDFKLVELDTRLRRQENSSTNVFPDFARDVFERRMRHAAATQGNVEPDLDMLRTFGKSYTPADEARMITGDSAEARRSVVNVDHNWPEWVVQTLHAIADHDPLSARLGEAWIRQKGADEPFEASSPPWAAKPYWRKERNEICLLQIAGGRRQRAIIAGEVDIIALSGGNILIFLSICQLIWDFASQAAKGGDRDPTIPIDHEMQTIGAIRAGRAWLDRIPSEYGRSHDRFRLVQKMGEHFAELLLPDRKLSNPGQNGVSLSIDELDANPEIKQFLLEAADYGNLVMSEHANRSGRQRRLKFYLNPVYCPIYRIPFQRSKEPLYLKIEHFKAWLAEAGIIEKLERVAPRRPVVADTPLLDLLESND